MAGRNSFYSPTTGILKCHGFVESNEFGDIKVPVSDDFTLEPGKWRWDGTQWVSYKSPKPPVMLTTDDVVALLVAKDILKQKAVDDTKAAKG